MMRHDIKPICKVHMILHDDVCVLTIRQNELPIRRQHMAFPLVLNILRRIAAFARIAVEPPFLANVLVGVDENAQIEQGAYFFVMEKEQPFHQQHRRRFNDDGFALLLAEVVCVLCPRHHFASQ